MTRLITRRFARLTYACLALLAALAGLFEYTSHARRPPPSGEIAVPSGHASPPSSGDLAIDTPSIGPLSTTIPEHLPNFTLSDTLGKATSIDRWRGRSLVLNFWATWCAPCRHEIPLLQALDSQWAPRNVTVIGIAVDYRDKVQRYAAEMNINYPILVGEQDGLDLAAQLGVQTPVFPFTVFTDRGGDVVAVYVGELHRPEAELILNTVESLNGGHSSLPEARRAIAAGLGALAAAHADHIS